MNVGQFHNALRIMNSIDRDEMVAAGLIPADDHHAWQQFRCNPTRWMIGATDPQKEGLFALIESRQPKPTPPTELNSIKLPVRVEQMIGAGGKGPVLVDADGCQIAIIGALIGDIGNGLAEALAFAVNSYPEHEKQIEQLMRDLVCNGRLTVNGARCISHHLETLPVLANARAE